MSSAPHPPSASNAPRVDIASLLREFDRATAYTDSLWTDLTDDEIRWRPHERSSAIGWHLGHQAAVAHYMVRNLVAAEAPLDAALDRLMDSATPEPERGDLPDRTVLERYRRRAAASLHRRIDAVDRGDVGAPAQLRHVAIGLLVAVVNHEYQHSQWIGEVRSRDLGHGLPDRPTSDLLTEIDGYLVIA